MKLYVHRHHDGKIKSLHSQPQVKDHEEVDTEDAEVVAYFKTESDKPPTNTGDPAVVAAARATAEPAPAAPAIPEAPEEPST